MQRNRRAGREPGFPGARAPADLASFVLDARAMHSNAWLGLLAIALAGAAACSAEPLTPTPMDGSSGGTTGKGGTTGAGGTTGVGGNVGSTGTGGAAGGTGDGGVGAPCIGTEACAAGEVCTTEDGVCNPPPGCGPSVTCPAVCFGTCREATDVVCGAARCAAGSICCNASCGICAAPGSGCTKQLCEPPAGGGACKADGDCRVEADTCTGCDCRPLATGQALPPCAGPGARCLLDPCGGATAACVNGYCVIE